jgi:hypothetical protein
LFGGGGNDLLTGGIDDALEGGSGTNDLSAKAATIASSLAASRTNGRAAAKATISSSRSTAMATTSSAGDDAVQADAEERVAASCENVLEPSSSLRAGGATPEVEVTINGAPEEFGS